MHDRETNDLAIHCIDVGKVAPHSTRMRDGKLGVHRRVEVLLREKAPAREDARILFTRELGTPRPVIKSFIATKEKRRHRTAESKRIPPVVRRDESAIDTHSNLAPAIGAVERELAVG